MIPVDLNCSSSGPRDAPVLLLGGSLGTTLDMWDPQVPELSTSHRVIRFEHRGHGGSPVPTGPYTIDALGDDVLTMLDRLDLPRVSYCGLSIGGMVGQWLAINAPERDRPADPAVHRAVPASGRGLARARGGGARGGHARGRRRCRDRPVVHARTTPHRIPISWRDIGP